MKIKMKERVENSYPLFVKENGRKEIKKDTRIFQQGVEYDLTEVHEEWDERAQELVDLGFAEIVG